ncbi:MAG: NAD(P)-dependent oxidoreductase [Ruminococcus sp.]|nr:NAD(P)-dependent oxidoreductase [Ruminococcus sp.]
MKIAIVGAGGFLGTALMNKLADNQIDEVYAFSFDFERQKASFPKAENIIPVDNDEMDTFPFEMIDVVIHCAFPRNADSKVIAGGMHFAAKAIQMAARSKAIIHISSQSVYCSIRDLPAQESDMPEPETKYAIGKYAMELLVNSVCGHIPHTNIRMASLIGPGFDQRVTNKMVAIALETGQLHVKEDMQHFGYLDIKDAADGILSLLQIPSEKWRHVYNLGSPQTYSLREIAETIADVVKEETGKEITITFETDTKLLNSALDGSALSADTGFTPGISLRTSIHRILNSKQ